MKIDYVLLEKMINCFSPTGSEEGIANIIKNEIEDLVDEVYKDTMGNLIAHKKGLGKKLMFAAHMDEIGLMITSIDDNGFLKFCSLGSNNPICLAGNRVVFENGTKGTIHWSSLENHADLKFEDMFIDIGVESKAEAEKLVEIGDACVFDSKYYENDNCIIGRNIDDRIGCYLMVEAIKAKIDSSYDIYYVFTVQEEVGCRGSKTAAFRIRPDIGIAVDVVPTGDIPIDKGAYKELPVKFGNGLSIRVKDGSFIASKKLNKAIMDLAKIEGIKYQVDALAGAGTDSSSMQQTAGGALVTCLNVPMRYIHTANGMMCKQDIEEGIKLMYAILKTDI